MKPVIGLTGRRMSAAGVAGGTGLAHQDIDMYFSDYAQSIAGAGGIPVQLTRDANANDLVSILDGLVLSGGADIDPSRYNAAPHEKLGETDPGRDVFELELLAAARAKGIPVLGICRGCQLINVAFGGTLRQHVDLSEGSGHPNWLAPGDTLAHDIEVTPGSLIETLMDGRHAVNSLHHQTLDVIGPGLRVTAVAPDGVPEAIEAEGEAVLAVQWHPEMLGGPDPTFFWLIEQALEKKRS